LFMADFQMYNSGTHPIVRLQDDWNNVLDHGLDNPCNYIIRRTSASYYEALNGSTTGTTVIAGTVAFGGAASAGATNGVYANTVIQAAINNLPVNSLGGRVGTIILKNAIYSTNATITIPAYSDITIKGEGFVDCYSMQIGYEHTMTGGAMIRYEGTTNGTSIISVPVNTGQGTPADMTSRLTLENLRIHYISESYVGKALDLSGWWGGALINVVVGISWDAYTIGPMANSYGVYVPFIANERRIMENVAVFGYATGYYLASDHLCTNNISAMYCTKGFDFEGGNGQSHNYIHTAYCQTHINYGTSALNTYAHFGTIMWEDNIQLPWITDPPLGFNRDVSMHLIGTLDTLNIQLPDARVPDFTVTNHVNYPYLSIGKIVAGSNLITTVGPMFDMSSPIMALRYDTENKYMPFKVTSGVAYIAMAALAGNTYAGLSIIDKNGKEVDFENGRITVQQKGIAVAVAENATDITVNFPNTEPNGAYQIIMTFNFPAQHPSVDSKGTGSARLNWANVAPAGATVDWFLMR
jgi:hypothetical protein